MTSASVLGGERIEFVGGRADLPDHIADHLLALRPDVFSVVQTYTPENLSRVLIRRDMGLGDVLLATPLPRALKARAGDRPLHVTFATEPRYACLFDGNPHVDSVVNFHDPFQRRDYDMVVDLRLYVEKMENMGDHKNRALAFAAAADVDLKGDFTLDYFVTDDERAWARGLLGGTPTLAMVWRSSTANRNWTPEKSLAVLRALTDAGVRVAVLDHEHQLLPRTDLVLNFTGAHSIRQTGAVMDACAAALTPDTGLFHLAQALRKPTVTYFGAMRVEERWSHPQSLTVLNNPVPCLGCRKYYCFYRQGGGAAGVPACIDLAPARVVEAVRAALTRLQETP